jgi:hypothetical protein
MIHEYVDKFVGSPARIGVKAMKTLPFLCIAEKLGRR